MDENISEEEKKCPICSKVIRSDATIHEYCKLCGMEFLSLRRFQSFKPKRERYISVVTNAIPSIKKKQ